MDSATPALSAPLGLLAELTHRCPLACPYCSNPLALEAAREELDTATWARVFREAAALGFLPAHLSAGEPAARRALADLVGEASAAGLYTNLITSGVGLTGSRLQSLADRGLDHVQVSIQDAEQASADRIAGYEGGFVRKQEVAAEAVRLGLPLTVNVVVHRLNIARIWDMVDMGLRLGAKRIEIAHVQYYGWALKNRAALMPTREQVDRAMAAVASLRVALRGQIVIDSALPDYYARYPKPCMGGWGRRSLNVTPSGKVLPCHAAEVIPSLTFWTVRERSLDDIWRNSPAFRAYRGTDWMQQPCRSCPRQEEDFGGCRCQALLLTGDAAATDPVCQLSPMHHLVAEASSERHDDFVYRD